MSDPWPWLTLVCFAVHWVARGSTPVPAGPEAAAKLHRLQRRRSGQVTGMQAAAPACCCYCDAHAPHFGRLIFTQEAFDKVVGQKQVMRSAITILPPQYH